MKRQIAWILITALLCVSAAAEENWYARTAISLAERMGKLAGDEAYVRMYTSDAEIAELAASIGAVDFAHPKSAACLPMGGAEVTGQLIRLVGGSETKGMSAEAAEKIGCDFPRTICTMLNASAGTRMVATASVCICSETFVQPEDFVPCVVFLEYDDEYGAAVSFCKTGSDTLTAAATPMPAGSSEHLFEDMPDLVRGLLGGLLRDLPLE